MVSHDEQLIGRIWCDRYEILDLVGKGGMGTVFKARQIKIDREVALKVIHRKLTHDEKSVQRFEKEALASSKLHHPNNIRVYDYGKSDDERLFIAMEFLRGQTLGDLISQEGPLNPARVVHIARQIGKSLAEANQVGLVHRDLKPENIFICDIHGEPDFVKVLDYGIAKAVGGEGEHANLTQTGFICGTPRYISPEQALGQPVDGRSDLYAMAVLMYEMLTGRPPFMGENPISIVMMHVYDDPPPLVGMEKYGLLGKRLTRLVGHMLEKNPNRRPASAEQVIQFLDGRIDENQLVGRSVPDPIPVLGAAEVHAAGALVAAPAIPAVPSSSGETVGSADDTNPSAPPVEGEATTSSGLPGPVAGLETAPNEESTMMVPTFVDDPDTQSEVATAFTEKPDPLRNTQKEVQETESPSEAPTAVGPEASILAGISADETTQLPAEQLQEAVDLLKKRRSNPKGLVRRRPSSTLNFKGIKRTGTHTPTPSGSTGLNLRTLPPPPQGPRPPIWALALMGVAIAVISVSIAAMVLGGDRNKEASEIHQDQSVPLAANEKEAPAQKTAVSSKSNVVRAGVEAPKPDTAVVSPVPKAEVKPEVAQAVDETPEQTKAGSLVGIQLAAITLDSALPAQAKPAVDPPKQADVADQAKQADVTEPAKLAPPKLGVAEGAEKANVETSPAPVKPEPPVVSAPKPKVTKPATKRAKPKKVKSVQKPKPKKSRSGRSSRGWTF